MNSNENIIQLKLRKANALFAEVAVLIQNEFYNTAINRIYYSCFHATNALLLTENIKSKTHSGTAGLLYQHFVLKNKFNVGEAAFYSNLIRLRMDSDYSDFLITGKTKY